MDPVNNCIATNEISPSSVAEKYGITEEYSKKHPEDSARALALARRFERASQAMDKLEQTEKKLSNGITRLEEDNKILLEQQTDLIESEQRTTQALQNLTNSSSELKEMTSNIANFAKRFFNPVRNGFNFLNRHREPLAVLPRENQLAIEDTPENTISDTDPTNQTSGDKKKNFVSLLMFFVLSGGLYFARAGEQKNL
ncbi:MAG: hypothetical protein ACRCU0_03585 [Candidatus Rhabdochlamydia sp.]